MTTLAIPSSAAAVPRRLAPLRHTLILIGFFLVIALWGALMQHRVAGSATLPRPSSPAALYLSLIAMEWGLVLYVWRGGLRTSGVRLGEWVGGRWSRPRDVAAALALAAWATWTVFTLAWDRVLGAGHAASVSSWLPRRPLDIGLWVVLSMSAGFCEELVFRGYLQTQLHALTGRLGLALVLQALLFGVSHGYQGIQACLTISLYGLMLGGLALARKSLRPGMLAHAWTDIASGIFRI
jgi:CAAX protease family protein